MVGAGVVARSEFSRFAAVSPARSTNSDSFAKYWRLDDVDGRDKPGHDGRGALISRRRLSRENIPPYEKFRGTSYVLRRRAETRDMAVVGGDMSTHRVRG